MRRGAKAGDEGRKSEVSAGVDFRESAAARRVVVDTIDGERQRRDGAKDRQCATVSASATGWSTAARWAATGTPNLNRLGLERLIGMPPPGREAAGNALASRLGSSVFPLLRSRPRSSRGALRGGSHEVRSEDFAGDHVWRRGHAGVA